MTAPDPLAPLRAQIAGSSFYAGMRMLPRARREAMFAIYGFCRLVDDIADDHSGDRAERRALLEGWRRDVDALYAGDHHNQAAFLAPAIAQFGLDRADFHAVIDGMAMDADGDIRAPDAATLDLYCDRVASAVGRLSVKAFGMAHDPGVALAHHLGRALQLTNILRDIDEDAAIGRLYLPREHLHAAGIETAEPAHVAADARLDHVCRAVAADAHQHYAAAAAILKARPKGHLIAPRLMEAVYARILRRMEAVGWAQPRHRVRIAKPELLWIVAKTGIGL